MRSSAAIEDELNKLNLYRETLKAKARELAAELDDTLARESAPVSLYAPQVEAGEALAFLERAIRQGWKIRFVLIGTGEIGVYEGKRRKNLYVPGNRGQGKTLIQALSAYKAIKEPNNTNKSKEIL